MPKANGVLSTPRLTAPMPEPELVQDAFNLPVPTSAPEYYDASQGSLRRAIEAQIETLLAFLDFIDVDPDLEPIGDDEPSLCGLTADPDPMRGDARFPLDAEHQEEDEDGHDIEATEGRPVPTAACGRMVLA